MTTFLAKLDKGVGYERKFKSTSIGIAAMSNRCRRLDAIADNFTLVERFHLKTRYDYYTISFNSRHASICPLIITAPFCLSPTLTLIYYRRTTNATIDEADNRCIGMGTIGITWVPPWEWEWQSYHGNGNGSGNKSMGMEIEPWEWEWISISASRRIIRDSV